MGSHIHDGFQGADSQSPVRKRNNSETKKGKTGAKASQKGE